MEGIGVVEKICKNKVRWRTTDHQITNQKHPHTSLESEKDIETLKTEIEKLKTEVQLADAVI